MGEGENNIIEKIINEILKYGEEFIDIMRKEYFIEYTNGIQKEHYNILEQSCNNAIGNQGMNIFFEQCSEKLQIDFVNIHYLKQIEDSISNRWLPILHRLPKDVVITYKKWLKKDSSGLEHLLCFIANQKGHKDDYIIHIDSTFFKNPPVKSLINIMAETEGEDLDSILESNTFKQNPGNVFENHISFNKNCNGDYQREISEILKNEQNKKIFSSFLLGARANKELYIGKNPSNLYFYNNPDLGGIAFVSIKNYSDEELEKFKSIFRRLISLVGIFDGFISYWISTRPEEHLYTRYQIIDINPLIDNLKKAVEKYLKDLQLPHDILGDNIYLEDILNPIYVVKRIGNRKDTQEDLTIVVRLGIKNEEAFNFLYLDNAHILSKTEEFLSGWIKGYLSSGKRVSINDDKKTDLNSNSIKVRLDVYISPTVNDIEARKRNPYTIKAFDYDELMIKTNSNFDSWNKKILENTKESMPAVIYRYSELVGPSIFIGEIASAILKHYWTCCSGCKSEPLKVLDLFYGTGASEATILKNCGNDIKIHFAGLDLNPYLLSDAFAPTEIPSLLRKVKTHTHIIPVDIFDIFTHIEKDPRPLDYPRDIYSQGYDLVLSDPPHFLSLDFLYQKVRWIKKEGDGRYELKEDTLMKHLAEEAKVKCFILYFGHKEKEWLSFFIHRALSKEGWPDVWSLLFGDERFALCFNKFDVYKGVSTEQCRTNIINNLREIADRYNFNKRGLKIKLYDTYYRILNA